MNLGEKILELRKKFNYTQEKLANEIGVSRQTLSNWESDITSPNIEQAKQLASLFKVSLDDLTNHLVEVECSKKNILFDLIGKSCFLESYEIDDYRMSNKTLCKILDVNDYFIKIEFQYKKEMVMKILDLSLIDSILYEEEA
jgi:Predicted transcriptional regulators